MLCWIKQLLNADKQTKIFAFMAIIYGAAIILSTAYVYMRLDFVRNQPAQTTNLDALRSK